MISSMYVVGNDLLCFGGGIVLKLLLHLQSVGCDYRMGAVYIQASKICTNVRFFNAYFSINLGITKIMWI